MTRNRVSLQSAYGTVRQFWRNSVAIGSFGNGPLGRPRSGDPYSIQHRFRCRIAQLTSFQDPK